MTHIEVLSCLRVYYASLVICLVICLPLELYSEAIYCIIVLGGLLAINGFCFIYDECKGSKNGEITFTDLFERIRVKNYLKRENLLN